MGDIARKYNVRFHICADDCQLYVYFEYENRLEIVGKMESLICDIKTWMTKNMVKLNDDKTKFLVLAGPRRDCFDYPSLSMGNENIVKSEFVTLLGVERDDRFTLKRRIRNIAKNCFFKLRNMYKIRKCINEDAAKIMVNSMITSKLDYCNAILYGLPNCDLDKL